MDFFDNPFGSSLYGSPYGSRYNRRYTRPPYRRSRYPPVAQEDYLDEEPDERPQYIPRGRGVDNYSPPHHAARGFREPPQPAYRPTSSLDSYYSDPRLRRPEHESQAARVAQTLDRRDGAKGKPPKLRAAPRSVQQRAVQTDPVLRKPPTGPSAAGPEAAPGTRVPPFSLVKSKGGYELFVRLVGCSGKSVHICLRPNFLFLEAEAAQRFISARKVVRIASAAPLDTILADARGSYSLSLPLRRAVDTGATTARLVGGLLVVSLPFQEADVERADTPLDTPRSARSREPDEDWTDLLDGLGSSAARRGGAETVVPVTLE